MIYRHLDDDKSRFWLAVCIVVNLAILFAYKYLDFAAESVFALLDALGLRMQVPRFGLLLPVGISFYTFQAIGYTIDVSRRKVAAEPDFCTYALFVAFFPQLVAGPIERAANLLPQFHQRHRFDAARFADGLRLMVWGYFMKLCIAENVAPYVDAVYNNLPNHNGLSIWLATLFFTFQILSDFGGYSLIAIGAARCLGFTLMQNFRRPYLTASMRDFWRRWHVSLSSWFTEYVYIPLGGNRCSALRNRLNTLATMLVSGLWHGANWTFVAWGGYHGVLLVAEKWLNPRIPKAGSWAKPLRMLFCFVLVMVGWVFFRANTMADALTALRKMALDCGGLLYNGDGKPSITLPLLMIALLMAKEIKDERGWRIRLMSSPNVVVSALATAAMVVVILLCAKFESGQFIYFQF